MNSLKSMFGLPDANFAKVLKTLACRLNVYKKRVKRFHDIEFLSAKKPSIDKRMGGHKTEQHIG